MTENPKRPTLFGSCALSCGGLVACIVAALGISETLTTGAFQGARRGYSYSYTRVDDPFSYWAGVTLFALGILFALWMIYRGLKGLFS